MIDALINIFSIVFSVTLALYLNKKYEDYKSKKRTKIILLNIKEEITQHAESLPKSLESNTNLFEQLRSISESTVINISDMHYNKVILSTFSFASAKASDTFDEIDVSLLKSIFQYYHAIEERKSFETELVKGLITLSAHNELDKAKLMPVSTIARSLMELDDLLIKVNSHLEDKLSKL